MPKSGGDIASPVPGQVQSLIDKGMTANGPYAASAPIWQFVILPAEIAGLIGASGFNGCAVGATWAGCLGNLWRKSANVGCRELIPLKTT